MPKRRLTDELERLRVENENLREELRRCEDRGERWFTHNCQIDEAIRAEHARLNAESRRVLRFNSVQVLARIDALLRVLH
jgi:hypothetical protein